MKRLFRNVLAACVAMIVGVGSASAQTDVTSTYLTNADFEGTYSVYYNPKSDRAIYQPNGWTVNYSNGESNDMTSLNSSCLAWDNFSSKQQPSNGGNNTYWIRFRWGNSESLTLSQTLSSALPAGTYRLSADAFWNGSNSTATIGIAGQTYNIDPRNTWATHAIIFTLTETTNSIVLSFNLKQNAQVESILGIDNFKLEKFEQSTTDLAWNWSTVIGNPSFEKGTEGSFTGYSSGWANKPVGFSGELSTGWTDGSINTTNPSNGSSCYNLWSNTFSSSNIYQNIVLPMGKYTITADMRIDNKNSVNDQGVYATVGNETYKSGTITSVASTWNSTEGWNTLSKDFYVTSDNTSVRVGVSSTGTGSSTVGWYQVDNFTLTYKGAVAKMSTTLEMDATTALTTDSWYAISIPAAGEYKITSTAATTLYYTNEGYKSPGDVTSTIAVTVGDNAQTLSAGSLYFRSTTATNVTFSIANYTYTVGSATASHAYVQGGETVTVTYADAATNDPSASFAKHGTPTITFGSTTVTTTATANGFTFTVPSGLTAATTYTLSIPAGAFGYADGETYNAAQEITFNTPAVLDGTYFLKVAGSTTDLSTLNTSEAVVGKYLSRGTSWGTHATLDNYGLPVIVSTDKDNYTVLKVYDTQRYYYIKDSWDLWADRASLDNSVCRFIVTSQLGKLAISPAKNTAIFFKFNDSDVNSASPSVYYDGNGTNSGPIILWETETPAAHASVMTGYKNSQATTAAAAAYAGDNTAYASLNGVTSVLAMEDAVASLDNYTVVGGANPTTVTEKYQGDQPNPAPETVYSSTLTIPAPGLYRFSMQAFYRASSNENTQAMHTDGADFSPVVLFFDNAETQIKSLYDEDGGSTAYVSGNDAEYNGMYYANNTDGALAMFQEGKYHNDVWFYAPAAGEYTYGVKYMGWANASMQWFIYSPEAVTVTYYGNGTITTANGVVTVLGNNELTAINNALTSDIAVLDIERAVGLSSATISTTNNPNLLIYANSGQVSNSNNVIINGTCTNLVLSKQSAPFFVPTAFTATNAKYTVAESDLAGGQFATMMIPFAANIPTGKAYTLDQGVNALGGEVKATEVSTVPANSPVLITGSGQLTGSSVSVPVIAKNANYESGELVGVYTTTTAPVGSYVLQNHTESPNGVAFYRVGETKPSVGPFRAYIKAQSSSIKPRALYINFDGDLEPTLIGTIDEDGNVKPTAVEYYTAGGTRLSAPQKGLNIVKYGNGTVKKVFIK